MYGHATVSIDIVHNIDGLMMSVKQLHKNKDNIIIDYFQLHLTWQDQYGYGPCLQPSKYCKQKWYVPIAAILLWTLTKIVYSMQFVHVLWHNWDGAVLSRLLPIAPLPGVNKQVCTLYTLGAAKTTWCSEVDSLLEQGEIINILCRYYMKKW